MGCGMLCTKFFRKYSPVVSVMAGMIACGLSAASFAGNGAGELLEPMSRVRPDLKFKVITRVSKNDVYEGHLFHAGLLWVGMVSESGSAPYSVDVYANGGESKVASLLIPHSVASITAYDDDSVVVIGRSSSSGWRTHYTVITKTGSTFKVKTIDLPVQYMVSEFAGASGHMFFSEVGDANILNLNLANNSIQPLPFEISGPGRLELDGNSLFVLENRNIGHGDENIIKVNLLDNTHKRTFTDFHRNGLINIKVMKGTNYLAATELSANKVLLIERTKNALAHEIEIKGGPRGISQLGHCLVVSTEDEQGLVFIDLSMHEPEMIDRWDLTEADPRFKKARSVSVDETTGQIFLRSTYFCGSCDDTQSSVVRIEQMEGVENSVVKKCMGN